MKQRIEAHAVKHVQHPKTLQLMTRDGSEQVQVERKGMRDKNKS